MKFLIAGYSYEDSFADNVSCALEEMGHDVRTLGQVEHAKYHASWRYYLRAIQERIAHKEIDQDGEKLLEIASEFKPDIVLMLTREYSPDILFNLKHKFKVILITWWTDPPAYVKRWGFSDPIIDLVFLKDSAAIVKTRLVRGDVYLLHEAMNPRWHKPLAQHVTDEIVVAGNYYAFRQQLIKKMFDQNVKLSLYGSSPPAWSLPDIKQLHSGRYIVREEKSRIFGEAFACLNNFQFAEGNSLNCRAFEIAGAGGLQLIEHRPAIQECFEPGKEVLTFSTYEELCDHITMAKSGPRAAQEIRDAGALRALSHHTYKHRINEMLSYL